MLRSASEAGDAFADSGLTRPHVDAASHNPDNNAVFVYKISEVVTCWSGKSGASHIWVYFAYKGNGRLRVIFETRVVNCFFKDPLKTRLPTAASSTSIETTPGEQIYFGGGDIENAFYRILAPELAKKYFTLPGIGAKHLGFTSINGVPVSPDTIIVPRLRVLPMGRNWSLWICQMIHEQCGLEADQSDHDKILDHTPLPPLRRHSVLHAKYVDNFLL